MNTKRTGRPRQDPNAARVPLPIRVHPKTNKALRKIANQLKENPGKLVDGQDKRYTPDRLAKDLRVPAVKGKDRALQDSIYLKFYFEGCDGLEALAVRAEEMAKQFREMKAAGVRMLGEPDGGWVHLEVDDMETAKKFELHPHECEEDSGDD